ncbi:peroxisomal membrane protein 2-like [Portunus trituberculatus]|uniref:peroxisomal membrane protein 2-like n=1 Tax=Portunus trituberculatus TaxID=210409 RepID=UPI001E1CE717|nr:peroxisomal membrane protein 2-like [Portunus trituberculatus]
MVVVSVLQKGLTSYNGCLASQPLVTKSCTSAITAALGDYLGQLISRQHAVDLRSIARYATFGLLVTGPLAHNFYLFLDRLVRPGVKGAAIKRLLIERLGFAPLLVFLSFYLLSRMEGKSHAAAMMEVRMKWFPTLKMNWRVWTPIQYFNVNYVPQQYRSLFANFVALFWIMYLANKRRQAVKK